MFSFWAFLNRTSDARDWLPSQLPYNHSIAFFGTGRKRVAAILGQIDSNEIRNATLLFFKNQANSKSVEIIKVRVSL